MTDMERSEAPASLHEMLEAQHQEVLGALTAPSSRAAFLAHVQTRTARIRRRRQQLLVGACVLCLGVGLLTFWGQSSQEPEVFEPRGAVLELNPRLSSQVGAGRIAEIELQKSAPDVVRPEDLDGPLQIFESQKTDYTFIEAIEGRQKRFWVKPGEVVSTTSTKELELSQRGRAAYLKAERAGSYTLTIEHVESGEGREVEVRVSARREGGLVYEQ